MMMRPNALTDDMTKEMRDSIVHFTSRGPYDMTNEEHEVSNDASQDNQ